MTAAATAVRSWPDVVPLPERTLGWEFALFCTDHLVQPDGPDAGSTFKLTREQLRIALRWFEFDQRTGRFVHRRGVIRRMKGWGKDPFAAALIWFEALGRCRMARGRPVQHAAPWVQVAASSRDQTRNTMTLLAPMLTRAARDAYGVDLGKEIIYLRGGHRIEVVTSSPTTIEGGRPSFVLKNETQHWLPTNRGDYMSQTIARNLGKSRDGAARSLAIQNAHVPGLGSVAEEDYDTWQSILAGRSDSNVYYDATEAPADTDMADRESLRAGLVAARGDSVWLDVDRIIEEILDPSTPVETSRRFYLNQVVAAADALFLPSEYDGNRVDDELAAGDEIVLGFDGGKSDDATALIAMRVEDRLVQPLGIWQAPDGPDGAGWEIDREQVSDMVEYAFSNFRVSGFFADVALWEAYIELWSMRHRHELVVKASPRSSIGWDMRGGKRELTLANEALMGAVIDGRLPHRGGQPLDHLLRQHALNARRRVNAYGTSFGKVHRESGLKVDGWAALLLADMARTRLLESGKRRVELSGEAFFL